MFAVPMFRKEKAVHISVNFGSYMPTIEMRIVIPPSRDEEEYIDEFLDTVLADEFRYNCVWDFI